MANTDNTQDPGNAFESGATSGAVEVAGVGEFDPEAVLAWATENGVQLPAPGQLSSDVLQKYRDAH